MITFLWSSRPNRESVHTFKYKIKFWINLEHLWSKKLHYIFFWFWIHRVGYVVKVDLLREKILWCREKITALRFEIKWVLNCLNCWGHFCIEVRYIFLSISIYFRNFGLKLFDGLKVFRIFGLAVKKTQFRILYGGLSDH